MQCTGRTWCLLPIPAQQPWAEENTKIRSMWKHVRELASNSEGMSQIRSDISAKAPLIKLIANRDKYSLLAHVNRNWFMLSYCWVLQERCSLFLLHTKIWRPHSVPVISYPRFLENLVQIISISHSLFSIRQNNKIIAHLAAHGRLLRLVCYWLQDLLGDLHHGMFLLSIQPFLLCHCRHWAAGSLETSKLSHIYQLYD